MPGTPIVSVLIPLYNRKKYIKRAIISVLNQSFKNFEIIIIDDGSTDTVEKVLFPLLKKEKKVKYIRHSNRGPALSLNEGMNLAQSEFITFLDSDDEYTKNHLSKRVKYFRDNPRTDLTYSTAKIIGKDKDMYVPDVRNPKNLIHLDDCIIGGTFFGKKEVFEKLNGFRDIYAYDYDFHKRAVMKFKVVKLDMPTYIYYRNTSDSILTHLKKKHGN